MQYGPENFAQDIHVSRETRDRLKAYAETLAAWQKKINLVGPKTLPDLWRRHMLDSAQLAALLPNSARPLTIVDMGSGAGFPGLVLAAMGAGQAHLIESDSRKCAFLRAAARAMGIAETVTVHNDRIEALPAFPADVITARALADLSQLLAWGEKFATEKTLWLFLKGQDAEEELTRAASCWTMRTDQKPSMSDRSGRVLILSGVKADGRAENHVESTP